MRAYYFLYYLGVCHLMSILSGKKIIVTGVANKKVLLGDVQKLSPIKAQKSSTHIKMIA